MRRLLVLTILVALLVPGSLLARPHRTGCDDPTPPPPSFSSVLAAFISYSDDVMALRAWFETLSAAEQQQYTAQFQAAVDKLAAMEDAVVNGVLTQLDEGCCDSNLYVLFETIKGMDAIKARKIFTSAVSKVSARINQDYLANPQNPDMGRRGRDMQAVRAYIRHNG
ncbi:MAG: hypothetical protein HY815_08110 [Candidatus Riflebacteria bacterium]|nr:hypothetical protein [Candidatus Riflebacteria bacterium]